jgi:hypothetical protein
MLCLFPLASVGSIIKKWTSNMPLSQLSIDPDVRIPPWVHPLQIVKSLHRVLIVLLLCPATCFLCCVVYLCWTSYSVLGDATTNTLMPLLDPGSRGHLPDTFCFRLQRSRHPFSSSDRTSAYTNEIISLKMNVFLKFR